MTDRYAELRAALDAAEYLGDNCFVTINSAHGRALLAERDALLDAVEALLANPSGMYCDGYPEAERKARAALAQGEV